MIANYFDRTNKLSQRTSIKTPFSLSIIQVRTNKGREEEKKLECILLHTTRGATELAVNI